MADLIVGNNVLAQVPDLNDFIAGMKIMLEDQGCGNDRVPAPRSRPSRAISSTQIYHEHFSYFSLLTCGDGVCASWAHAFRRGRAADPWRLDPHLYVSCRE